jgi:hypothetical protein
MISNKDNFRNVLTKHYIKLYETPDYVMAKSKYLPGDLANKVVEGLIDDAANKSGKGIQLTIKELGIKNTYKAIKQYLNG